MSPLKLPAECKACGNDLTLGEMGFYLDLCERAGKDPLHTADSKDPGILCALCLFRAIDEMADTEPPLADPLGGSILDHDRSAADGEGG